MALQFGIEPPAWLMDEIKWRRGISSQFTKELLGGVALAGEVLQQKQQRQALQNQADEQARMNQDMESFPVWLQQHDNDPTGYVPKSNWGHQASQQAWQQKYQRGIVDLRREQANSLMDWRESQAELNKAKMENTIGAEKSMIESDKRFTKGLDMFPDLRAQIVGKEGIPAKPGQHWSPEQWGRLQDALTDAGKTLEPPVKAQSPMGKLQADRQAAIDSGAPDDVIKAYDQAIAKQGPDESKEPLVKVIPGVGPVVWKPGSKHFQIAGKGELTPSQAEKLAEQPGMSKEDRAFFRQYAIARGKEQTHGFEATPEPAKPEAPKTPGFWDTVSGWFKSSKTEPKPGASAAPAAAGPSAAAPASHEEEADIAARSGTKSLPKVKNQADIDKAIDQANKALQNGADRDWVLNRLKELGVPVKE